MAVISYHGIPPSHPTAEEFLVARLGLNRFLAEEDPDLILTSQPIVADMLASRWASKIKKPDELAWDERSGLYAFHAALCVKYATINGTVWKNCPFHCHEKYGDTYANIAFLDGTNNGYFKFVSGYACALFEVNEMYFRYREGRLNRIDYPKSLAPPTNKE